MIVLRLPMPPSVNGLYANVVGKGRVKSARYKTWINAAGNSINAQRPFRSIEGDYVIRLGIERPDDRKRDLFNMVKAVEDLLVEHGIVQDDSLCIGGHVFWEGPGRECTVWIESAKPVRMARAA